MTDKVFEGCKILCILKIDFRKAKDGECDCWRRKHDTWTLGFCRPLLSEKTNTCQLKAPQDLNLVLELIRIQSKLQRTWTVKESSLDLIWAAPNFRLTEWRRLVPRSPVTKFPAGIKLGVAMRFLLFEKLESSIREIVSGENIRLVGCGCWNSFRSRLLGFGGASLCITHANPAF